MIANALDRRMRLDGRPSYALGTFEAVSDGERLIEVRPWRGDPEPMSLIGNVVSAASPGPPHRRAAYAQGLAGPRP
jgi:hypothetical protein